MEGFAVHVGGGMGAFSRVADLLEDFIPTTEIHYVAEAVKRVFDKHGNRKNRNKARLRFLIEEIGLEQFRRLYQCELEDLRKQGLGCLDVRPLPKTPRSVPPEEVSPANGFEKWRINNISPQMQEDFYLVHIPLALGDIPADTIEKLANVVENCGEGSIRTTQCQNIALRWVHEKELPSLHKDLKDLGIVDSPPPIIRNMIACAGASTCRLGICLSRGLADALTEKLAASDLDLDELGGMSVHISGCPNACGRHPAATIGFYGAARRKGGSLAPHYIVQLGGRVQEGETQLARGRDAIPAWRVPAFTVDLLKAFQTSDEYPNYQTFLDNGGREVAGGLAAKYRNIPSIEEDESCYRDWGAGELFSLAGRGPGECSAGVFDLIKVDLASAREALENGRPYAATVSASRALLVTTGKEAKGDTDALEGFAAHFIDSELVDESLRDLIEKGCAAATGDNPEDTFAGEESEVAALIETVETLYENMDASLRFKPSKVCR